MGDGKVNLDRFAERDDEFATVLDAAVRSGSRLIYHGRPIELETPALRPATWFRRVTDGALYPDLLKRARRDGRLPATSAGRRRWLYAVADVAAIYGGYTAQLAAALQRDEASTEPDGTSQG